MDKIKIALCRAKSNHSWEALGLGYLASYSYKFGFSREQYSFFDENFDAEEEMIVGCESADFIGFSVTSFSIKRTLELMEKIRVTNKKAKIIWGGYGVNGFSEELLLQMYGKYVDFFIQGPGEEAWLEIISLKTNQRVLRKEIISNLDDVPYPDRELIRIDRHFKKLELLGEIRKTSMEMQRGACPYDCIYCAGSSYAKPSNRSRTPENIVGEMIELRDKYYMDKDSMVLMCDAEVFLTEDMYKMAELRTQNEVNFRYGMNVVASTILGNDQRKTLEKMMKSGLTEVWMGVESDPSLMSLTGKPINPQQVKEAFRITKEMGLIRKAYFILGFTPEESEETIKNRIPFIEELEPEEVGFTIYIPVPGSRGYNHAIHSHIDYSSADEYYNEFTTTNSLTNEDLKYWQAYLVNYFRDKAAYRQNTQKIEALTKIKDKAGRSGY